MKTLLVGINSKYIHTCLAIWYLKASVQNSKEVVKGSNVVAREFTINDNKDNILYAIYMEKPDILAFSCYIWNIELINILTTEIKKLLPKCRIILGGPEVSFTASDVLEENETIDFIICGEGEEVFPALLKSISEDSDAFKELSGVAYRENKTVCFNEGYNLVSELDRLRSPYTENLLKSMENRIIYYEASRGCPFFCSYCISSTFKGVRFFSLDRVKKDINYILQYRPKLIKFVDRTFNCNRKRAKEIVEFIISLKVATVFHFEAAADLFDDELLALLANAPKGRLQFEIGLQTTNADTLCEIDRVTDLCKLKSNVERLLQKGNIHIHLDLIAGLPLEDINSFKRSFNDVYNMKPHQLQLGFLKLLKGSKVRREAEKHGYIYRDYSPYEILSNSYISFEELLILKDMEEVVERYFNSNRFPESLGLLQKFKTSDAFEVYRQLSVYCRENGYLDRPVSYRENISILFQYGKTLFTTPTELEEFRQAMVFDFLSSDNSGAIPDAIRNEEDYVPVNKVHQILRNEEFIKEYLPDYISVPVKNIIKKVFLISLTHRTGPDELILFDYSQKDLVTYKFRTLRVTIPRISCQ